jgi:hypothetical protein
MHIIGQNCCQIREHIPSFNTSFLAKNKHAINSFRPYLKRNIERRFFWDSAICAYCLNSVGQTLQKKMSKIKSNYLNKLIKTTTATHDYTMLLTEFKMKLITFSLHITCRFGQLHLPIFASYKQYVIAPHTHRENWVLLRDTYFDTPPDSYT